MTLACHDLKPNDDACLPICYAHILIQTCNQYHSMNNTDNINITKKITSIDTQSSDNSNRIIAPVREYRKVNDDIRHGGDWEHHPRGEYVLLCREHLTHIQDFIENWEHISENLPANSPSDKLEEKVQSALKQSVKLYHCVADIVGLYNDPDYPCPEDFVRFNKKKEQQDGRYPSTRRRGVWIPGTTPVSPARAKKAEPPTW